jgi:osmotically-inducible protein OsmY
MKSNSRHWILSALAAASLCSALTACAPLLMGGAMVGGSMMAADRRTSGAQLEDQGIELRGMNRLNESMGERGHVNITSYNRQVLLTGEVPNDADRQLAEQTLAKVENVRGVVNELAVSGNSSLTQRSSDVIITGRIMAAFLDAKDLSANTFKVTTERGIAYLLGRVTQAEAARATEIARSVTGVQKVVRIFEYLSDEELQHLLVPPAKTEAAPKAP